MKIYNGENMILGRLAAVVAKDALLGEDVVVINCEKIVISGRKSNTFARELQRRKRKGYPLKSARGREAFKKIMCYIGTPKNVELKEVITIPTASAAKLPTLKRTTVGEVCSQLGGKA